MRRKKKRRKRVFNLLHGKCHWAAEVRKWKSQLIAQLMGSTVFFVAKRDRLGHECSVVRAKIFPRISFDSINRNRRWLFKSEREIYAEKFLNWFRFARWASLDAGAGLLVSTFFSTVMEPSRGKKCSRAWKRRARQAGDKFKVFWRILRMPRHNGAEWCNNDQLGRINWIMKVSLKRRNSLVSRFGH